MSLKMKRCDEILYSCRSNRKTTSIAERKTMLVYPKPQFWFEQLLVNCSKISCAGLGPGRGTAQTEPPGKCLANNIARLFGRLLSLCAMQ